VESINGKPAAPQRTGWGRRLFLEKKMKSASTQFSGVAGKLSLIALAVLASTCAMAEEPGWYVGGNVGQARAKIDDARITSGLLGAGATSTTIVDDNRDTAYKVYGGYQMNSNFALEGGYFDLGRYGFNASTVPAGTLDGSIRLRGLNLDLVGTLPISEKFSAFGRIGANYAQARDSFSGTGAVVVLDPNPSKRQVNPKLGLGLQYAFTPALSLRGELERYRVSDAVGNKGDIDLASIGLVYRFGSKVQAPAPRAVAPAPVVVAAAPPVYVAPPAPAPVFVPPPPTPKRVSFTAESLFGFDKVVLRPEGKAALDHFAADLAGTQYSVITVEGHTDRLGTSAYNQKLSQQRADSVKAYLVVSDKLDGSKINTVAKGESMPVTKADDCKGNKASPKLIACLQADRRVEIEVSGTR
jgi:OOP family OmpA-OmpF porin